MKKPTTRYRGAKDFSGNEQRKNKKFLAQKRRAFKAFFGPPKTMLQVAIETGILRANICRYKAEFQRVGTIQIVKKDLCPISKHRSGFLTTNPKYFPKNMQLKMFK